MSLPPSTANFCTHDFLLSIRNLVIYWNVGITLPSSMVTYMTENENHFLTKVDNIVNNFSNEVFDKIAKPFATQKNSLPIPEKIYHYTDGNGLKGILESGTFWLTDIFCLNDPSEIDFGKKIAADKFMVIRNTYFPRNKETINKLYWFEFERLLDDVDACAFRAVQKLFVCSFSTMNDDLAQWRAYADDGRGYMLQFDRAALDAAFEEVIPEPRETFLISYDLDKDSEYSLRQLQQKIACQAVLAIDKILKEMGDFTHPVQAQIPAMKLFNAYAYYVFLISMHFKHKGYIGENEYRYMNIERSIPSKLDIENRFRPNEIILYQKFPWKPLASSALKSILIGPAADREKSRRFVNDCLAYYHLDYKVDVNFSDIPYRSIKK